MEVSKTDLKNWQGMPHPPAWEGGGKILGLGGGVYRFGEGLLLRRRGSVPHYMEKEEIRGWREQVEE